jgi:hypothetical protein
MGCETSRLPHFVDSRLTGSAEVVGLTSRLRFTAQEGSWYSFLLEESHSVTGRIRYS